MLNESLKEKNIEELRAIIVSQEKQLIKNQERLAYHGVAISLCANT